PDGARRQAAAQYLGRQPRRMLHARARAADRGGAPAARGVDLAGQGRRRLDGDLRPDGDAGLEHDPGLGGGAMWSLPQGLPAPVPENDGIDTPYWEGTRLGELRVQRCTKCGTFRWGPEWICHKCLSFETDWHKVSGRGRIYSWERPWHPVHPALKGHG